MEKGRRDGGGMEEGWRRRVVMGCGGQGGLLGLPLVVESGGYGGEAGGRQRRRRLQPSERVSFPFMGCKRGGSTVM